MKPKRSNQDIVLEIEQLRERIQSLESSLDQDGEFTQLDPSFAPVNTPFGIEYLHELHLRKLVNAATIAILIINEDAEIVFANDVATLMFKYDKEAFIGLSLDELIPVHLRDNHTDHLTSFFANPEPRPMGQGLDLVALKRDGTEFPVEISLNVLQSNQNSLTVAFVVDVSELKESRLNFTAIVDTAAVGILIIDQSASITIANQQVADIFEYDKVDLFGMSLNELIPDESSERHQKYLAMYFKNPSPRPMGQGLELEGKRKDGTLFPVEIGLSSIRSDDITLGVAFVADITERRKAEERFRILIDTASIGILVIDNNGKIVLANQISAKYFQYEKADMKNMSLSQLIPIEYRQRHVQHLLSYFMNPTVRAMGEGFELVAQRRDGTSFPVEISLSSVQTDEGVLALAFIADISERKRAEMIKSQITEKLITGFGHDLKTPMASIITRLHILKKSVGNDLHHHTDLLTKHVTRLDELVENMLIMARLDSTEQIVTDDANLNHFLTYLVEAKQAQAQEKNISLTYDESEESVIVHFNHDLMSVAMNHLIRNAITYTNKSGQIRITLDDDPQAYIIKVQDNGIGISEDELPYIFNRFYRVDEARQASSSLNGLGLATTKRIMELHQGRIEIESELGEGTTVQLILSK